MRCPQCASESIGKFCVNCGQPLQRTCPRCGALVNADHCFCTGCGARLAAINPCPYHLRHSSADQKLEGKAPTRNTEPTVARVWHWGFEEKPVNKEG